MCGHTGRNKLKVLGTSFFSDFFFLSVCLSVCLSVSLFARLLLPWSHSLGIPPPPTCSGVCSTHLALGKGTVALGFCGTLSEPNDPPHFLPRVTMALSFQSGLFWL